MAAYLALYLIALAGIAAIAPGTTVYWDGFGYVLQAIKGDVGGLGLGRPVFAIATHVLARGWLGAGGSPWTVEPLLRVACAIVSCASAPLTARLAAQCGADRRAAWLAGLAVACSPAMAHVSGQVLTDGPSVTLVILACVLGAQAVSAVRQPVILALAAGLVLGLAVGVREQAIVSALTFAAFVWLSPPERRWRIATSMTVGLALAVMVPLAFVAATQPGYLGTVREWLTNMNRDRAARTYGWRDVGIYAAWILSLGPFVVTIGAARTAWVIRRRTRGQPLVMAIAVPAALQLAWLATFRGIGYSPRFLLAALPLVFAIPASTLISEWAGESRRRIVLAIGGWTLPLVVAVPIVHAQSTTLTTTMREWPARIQSLPVNAVIVTGQPCPAVPLVREIVRLESRVTDASRSTPAPQPDWEAVCPGWAWPADLSMRIDRAIEEGRPVAADLRRASWTGPEQDRARDELDRYVRDHDAAEVSGRLIVWRTSP